MMWRFIMLSQILRRTLAHARVPSTSLSLHALLRSALPNWDLQDAVKQLQGEVDKV
jgi:hypothetical protein